jgi:hypothetical protein
VSSGDPALTVLLEMIVEDTVRHDELLQRMVSRLREELESTSETRALPVPGEMAFVTAREESLSNVRALIRSEQEGARYLRHLARQDAELFDGYFSLLLDTIARDAEKHVHLLRYVLKYVEVS